MLPLSVAIHIRHTTMTPEEYQRQINLVKDRHHALDLTFEQAEKIFKYEQDKDTYSAKHIFSEWEEWDYELTTFKEILNAKQFNNYENFLKETIHRYEKCLIEQDNKGGKDIAYYEEYINFYETQFLPDFFKDPYLRLGILSAEKTKIEYLRAEYKRFLNDTKKELLVIHFRHNRIFKPNELKVTLLRHKLSYIFPNYSYFKPQMDKPTKAIAYYLSSQLRYLPDHIEELLTKKFGELKNFNERIFNKYYSNTAWQVVFGKQTAEEEEEYRRMALLLLDEEKYGS